MARATPWIYIESRAGLVKHRRQSGETSGIKVAISDVIRIRQLSEIDFRMFGISEEKTGVNKVCVQNPES